jgi:hypothetical protein
MRLLALLCCCLSLAACGGKDAGPDPATTGDGGLPIPAGSPRSVTGMPDPGRPLVVPQDAPATASELTAAEGDAALDPQAMITDNAEADPPATDSPAIEPAAEPASPMPPAPPPPAPLPAEPSASQPPAQ